MKKIYSLLVILLLLAGSIGSLSAQPQYYNYNTNGAGNSFPFNITGGKEVQLLYLPGDFNQPSPAPAGNIISISFRIGDSYPLGPWTYTDFTIKMAQSTITSFTSGAFYTTGLTTVYYRSSVSLSAPGGGWLTITLDTPFAYDPAQSLIVDVGQCGVPGATGFSACFTAGTGNRRIYSSAGCPFAYGSANTSIYHAGINIGASSPVALTGSATAVTGNSATLNGSVNANGPSTTVTFEYGLTAAYGSTVPGVPSPVSGNSFTPVAAAITGLAPATLYHYRVKAVSSAGTSNGADSTFTTPALAPTAVTNDATLITGTTATLNGNITAGGASTAVSFEYGPTAAYGTTVAGVPATVTGNTATPVLAAISGLTPNTTYHFRVKGVNTIGTTNGLDKTFFASDCALPGTPGTITGPATACANSLGNIYSVPAIPYAQSYAWTVPPGAVITAGGTTNSITVTMGTVSGNVTVQGVDTCGVGPTGSLPVVVVPAPVPTITGPDSMCVASGYFDYVTEPGMTNYTWTVSSGGTITYGQGTNQVQVVWNGSGSQTVSVNYMSATGCYAGTATALPVTVIPVPGPAGAITGTGTLCAGTDGIAYSVAPIPDANVYVWNLPAGATIAAGEWSPSILVDFSLSAVSGNITVWGNNICGNGPASPAFPVTVNPIPPVPVITLSGDTLTSSAPAGNQWYLDGLAIPGATGQTWIAVVDGEYWCDVTLNGCASDTSNHIVVVLTGIESQQKGSVSIRPVPNDGRFVLTVSTPIPEDIVVRVYDLTGMTVFERTLSKGKGILERVIDLRPVPAGIYTVSVRSTGTYTVKKIVVNQ